jgi:hypothetical protein
MQPFLRKLKLLIETCPEHVATFDETGTIFEILDINQFTLEITKHYKGTLNTFIRQLHFYGFKKIESTRNTRRTQLPRAKPNSWSFTHNCLDKNNLTKLNNCKRSANIDPPDILKMLDSLNSRLDAMIDYSETLCGRINSIESKMKEQDILLQAAAIDRTSNKRFRSYSFNRPSDTTSTYINPFPEIETEHIELCSVHKCPREANIELLNTN